ncbi:unnamed protein product [Agarophyton chilense]
MSVRDTSPPKTMNAVLCNGVQDYETKEVCVPELLPGELLLRVTRCGICAGDAKCYAGAPMFWGDDTRPAYVQTPVIPGHEFCGQVLVSNREGIEVGQYVTAEQVVACKECFYCKKGMRWLCAPHDIFGFHTNVHGGMAQFMKIPAKAIIHVFPNSLNTSDMVYTEPLSCSVHGVERADIALGDVVVVSGCGPIGLGMVAAGRLRGPSRLVAIDLDDKRLDIARECGADVVLNPTRDNVVQTVMDMTSGYGCDVYMEAAGAPSSVIQGLQSCRKGATMVEFSVFGKATTVDWTIIGDTKELVIKGGHCSGDRGYANAIDMLKKGLMPTDRIVSHSYPLDDVVEAIGMVSDGSKSIKVTVDPQAQS